MTGNRLALSLAVVLAVLLLAGLALPGAPRAVAAPLDKETCDKLKLEQGQLEQDGVRANMAKGPEWAKGNLKPEQLEQIHRIIEVDGQLLFRCNGRPLVTLPKDLDEPREDGSEPPKPKEENALQPAPEQPTPGKAAATDKAAATAKPATTEKAATTDKTPARKAKGLSGAKEQGAAASAAASGIKAKANPKANAKANLKAKSKADDAYKPPPTDPLADPFANKQPSDKN